MTETEEMEKDEQGTGHFELAYLLLPTIVEENISNEAGKIRDVLEKHGVVVSGALPEMKPLSYEMMKRAGGKKYWFHTAYFGHFIFQATPDEMAKARELIKKNDLVLRSILVKRTKESLTAAPRRIPRTSESRPKRTEEKSAPMDEAAVDKEIEKMVAAAE